MERSAALGVLTLSALGWFAGFLMARRDPDGRAQRAGFFYVTAVAVLVIIGGLVIPGRPVWSGGAAWGLGFVAGGLGALLAALVGLSPGAAGTPPGVAAAAAPLFAATGATAAVLLWLRPDLVAGLVGAATGWVAVSLLGMVAAHARGVDANDGPPVLPTTGIGFAVTVCAAAAMGVYRDTGGMPAPGWSATALLLAAGVPVLTLTVGLLASSVGGREPRRGTSAATAWWVVLAGGFLAGYAVLLGQRLLMQPRLGPAAVTGVLAAAVLWWLIAEGARDSHEGAGDHERAGVRPQHVLATLFMLSATVAAFYLLTGYGVGIMLIAAWLPARLAVALPTVRRARTSGAETRDPGESGALVAPWLYFGLIVLLYRLFLQRFEADLAGATLTDHFAIFTLIAGAFMPPLLAGVLVPPERAAGGAARSVFRLALTLVLVAAVPGTLLLLWGARAAVGLLAGLMLSTVITPVRTWHAVLAVAAALPMMQWAHEVVRLSDVPRADKVRVLIWLAAVVLAVIAASDYGQRVIGWIGRRRTVPSAVWHRGG